MSVFTPAQMAQLTLSSGASNDTEQIDLVFEQLEKGDALESVNEFLTELTADEKVYTTWRWEKKNIAGFKPNKGNPLIRVSSLRAVVGGSIHVTYFCSFLPAIPCSVLESC